MNKVVDFAFWPAQADKLAECTHNDTDPESSYLCTVDHYEACVLSEMGCLGGCNDDKTQERLFEFLDCFEGDHVSDLTPKGHDAPNATWLEFLEPCAKKAGIDHGAVETCANSGTGSGTALGKAWETINSFTSSQHLMFFPWVDVNKGAMMDGYDDCLLSAVCGNYTGAQPPSCQNRPKPPKGC